MEFFKNILLESNEYKKLSDAIEEDKVPAAITGVSGIHKAHIVNTLCKNKKKKALFIASDEIEAQRLANDLSVMGSKVLVYSLRDFTFSEIESKSREYEHQRINVLSKIIDDDIDIVISCIDAALQYTIPKDELKKRTFTLKVNKDISMEKIVEVLTLSGYERYEQVDGQGQFSVRGGILDIFPPDAQFPIRVEFWGDNIDTIWNFDIETQRRTEQISEFTIAPSTEVLVEDYSKLADKIDNLANSLGEKNINAKKILCAESEQFKNNKIPGSIDKFLPLIYNENTTLFDYFDNDAFVFVSELSKVKERMRLNLWQWEEDIKTYFSEGTLCKGLDYYTKDWIYTLDEFKNKKTIFLDTFVHGNYEVPIREISNFLTKQSSSWSGELKVLIENLNSNNLEKSTCVIMAGTDKAAASLAEDLISNGFNAVFIKDIEKLTKGKIFVVPGSLSAGFEYPELSFFLITHGIFLARSKKKNKKIKNAKEIFSLSELNIGDYVVHSAHGIGIFSGIHKITSQGVIKDYIKIRYAKDDVLYVPVTQLDMVSKYIGAKEDSNIKLNKLGGTEWQKTKARVKKAVKDMAKELILLYSERMKVKGHAFAQDNEWQRDFEARFEYEETADQLTCIKEIKHDMEREAPMDRLLCGDVGFGKTEVALRAAFKCVTDSKQCAILVPTTILAWQHFQTALRRFEGFPIRIELLSRFRTPKQQEEILKRLKRGEIDIIIGTHRLVQKDVEFRDLGLAIVDEEQRFGVAQKERFKEICKNIDILTLSATPIPRTLNMAMSGIRDMSVLEEAPQDRQPVQTYVLEHDRAIINEAIRKELRRGGQVYYLHNNVESISRVASNIQMQIPESKVGFGYGKMNENELSEVWRKMIDHEINVLVCTTIIETGVDIPNANTLIIENADRMGLSQLHQLRGRVGRSFRRAYAYFTFTRNKVLSEVSQKRLSAIREFTEFGSGFKIAMRDLELRGAGNILGGEQHGHMEDVGYDMYLKLLDQAVSEEKGETVNLLENEEQDCLVDIHVQAHIPESYISSLNQRLDVYRRISDIKNEDDASDVLDELIDRFGDVPKSVKGLIDVSLIRNMAASFGIYEIKQKNDSVLLYLNKLDMKLISPLICKMKGKVMLNAGAKPYLSIKILKDTNILDVLLNLFKSN